MRILIVGAGAVGGYFGARLAAAGRDVTFLVRASRAEQLRRDGLRVVTADDELAVQPKLVLSGELSETYDLVLLGVKAYALAQAMEDFAPAVGAETMVLPLLNGMAHIDTLVARFGERAVLGGATQISTDLRADGSIYRMTPLQDLVYGERSGGVTERMKNLEVVMHGAGFDDVLSENVIGFMWQKWVVLAALAGITTLFRATIGEVAGVERGVDVELAMIEETAAIANAAGHPAPETFLIAVRKRLTTQGSDLTASMLRDMRRGAPVEVEHVIGDLLRRGEQYGVAAPLLRAAYVQLSLYERGRLDGNST